VQVCWAGRKLSRRTLNKLEISDLRTAWEKAEFCCLLRAVQPTKRGAKVHRAGLHGSPRGLKKPRSQGKLGKLERWSKLT